MTEKYKKAFKIASKILWGIAWGLLGLVTLIVLWLSFDKFILKSPVPSFLGYSSLTIQTGSMNGYSAIVDGGEPKQVSIGDLIVIKKTNDYKIGDVITFLPEGDKIPTTHRIIGYTDDGFTTKGDANNTKDTVPISKDRVLGEVVGHYPKLGKFSSWVKQEGYMYIIATLGIIILGSFISKSSDAEKSTAETATATPSQTSEGNSQEGENQTQTSDGETVTEEDTNKSDSGEQTETNTDGEDNPT